MASWMTEEDLISFRLKIMELAGLQVGGLNLCFTNTAGQNLLGGAKQSC